MYARILDDRNLQLGRDFFPESDDLSPGLIRSVQACTYGRVGCSLQ